MTKAEMMAELLALSKKEQEEDSSSEFTTIEYARKKFDTEKPTSHQAKIARFELCAWRERGIVSVRKYRGKLLWTKVVAATPA